MSENLVGNAAVSGILCLCEAEQISWGDVGSLFASNPGSNFAFANRLASMRLKIRIQNGNSR